MLALQGLAETSVHHFAEVPLLHEVQVQLLDARHLLVVEPVGGLKLTDFVQHLSIELIVIDVARVVNHLPFRSAQADEATRARGVSQGVWIVRRRDERCVAWTVLLRSAVDGSAIHLVIRQGLLQGRLL